MPDNALECMDEWEVMCAKGHYFLAPIPDFWMSLRGTELFALDIMMLVPLGLAIPRSAPPCYSTQEKCSRSLLSAVAFLSVVQTALSPFLAEVPRCDRA